MGRRIQGQIFRHGFDSDVFVQNGLVTFYAKRGEIELANKVFGRLSDKTIVTWTSMISGYAQNGKSLEALRVYGQMRNTNLTPEWITFDMYSKTGSIADAGKLFDEMPERNIVTWNAYISNAVLDGRPKGALQTFREMPEKNLFAWNAMISGYAHQGSIADAGKLFDEMPERNIVTWNAYISNAVLDGRPKGALQAFIEFVWMGGEPDGITLCAFLNACADTLNLVLGKQLHGFVMRSGFESDVSVSNGLIDFYGKCKEVGLAEMVFDGMERRNLVTWGSMVATYEQNGEKEKACIAFMKCRKLGIEPTDALVDMYGNCGSIHDAEQTFREMPEKNLFAWNAMISGYAHQGHADMAIRLFREMERRNLVTWGSMVATYEQNGEKEKACIAFMKCRKLGIEPTDYMISSVVSACAELAGIELGRSVHALAVKSCVDADVYVGSALVDMYGKCESIHDAEQTFREMPEKNLFAWNAMISGYAHQGHADMAIMVFDGMERRNLVTWGSMVATYEQNGEKEKACIAFMKCRKLGIEPTDYVISSVVSACAELAGIELGRSVHALAVNSCVDADVYVGSALVDMYGKCGSIHDAEQTFREMPEKNLFAWNAMISGYAHQGHADMAIGLFREMASVVAPNYVTFVCVLSACSRGGAVETGMDVYESMMKKYGIEAGPEHYACVVDMLARSGLVERAYDFVQKLPIRPTISIWGALLNACRVHGKPEIGKIAADNLFELDPKDSGNHVLLSNMFAVAGR
ncbi:Pentatricopeptide repeat-containing protein At4g14850 [Linum perenne]